MTRYVLSPKLGTLDSFAPAPRGDELVLDFDILRPDLKLGLSIDDAIRQMKSVDAVPSTVGLENPSPVGTGVSGRHVPLIGGS